MADRPAALSGGSDAGAYRLGGHGYALLEHLDRIERRTGAKGAKTYQLEESHRARELVDAGLLNPDDATADGRYIFRVSLTERGRREVERGHPGTQGREVT